MQASYLLARKHHRRDEIQIVPSKAQVLADMYMKCNYKISVVHLPTGALASA